MKIDSIEELQKACEENRIADKKGFGEKTQQNILSSISFQQQNAGKYLYAKIESFAEAFTLKLKEKFPKHNTEITGSFRRQLEIIESLEWVTTVSSDDLKKYLITDQVSLVADRDGLLILNAQETLVLQFHIVKEGDFSSKLFETSCSEEFLEEWNKNYKVTATTEEKIFETASFPFIPAYLREKKNLR